MSYLPACALYKMAARGGFNQLSPQGRAALFNDAVSADQLECFVEQVQAVKKIGQVAVVARSLRTLTNEQTEAPEQTPENADGIACYQHCRELASRMQQSQPCQALFQQVLQQQKTRR